jgi:hypothetical protein
LCHHGLVLKVIRGLTLAAAVLVCVGCDSGTTSSLTSAASHGPTPATSLRATAIAWSRAFLTGSLADIRALQGPKCTGSTASPAIKVAYLKGLRAEMRHFIGVPLNQIRITGVQVRNATANSGEAEVEYDLPQSKTGNDNWVDYEMDGGRWKVANCNAPIGGESQSASASSSASA